MGVYSVATRLHELLGLAPNAFFAALLPALAAEHGAGRAGGAARTYTTVARRMALAGLVGAVLGLALADALVRFSFGPAYQEAAASLRVLAVLLIPLLVNRTTSVRLYATGREGLATATQALNVALRAGLGWPLVNLWGPPGAALANLVAESVTLGVFWVYRRDAPGGADPGPARGRAMTAAPRPPGVSAPTSRAMRRNWSSCSRRCSGGQSRLNGGAGS